MDDTAKVVTLRTPKQRVEAAWHEYTVANEKVHLEPTLENGIAAGKAYGRFVRLFAEIDGLDRIT